MTSQGHASLPDLCDQATVGAEVICEAGKEDQPATEGNPTGILDFLLLPQPPAGGCDAQVSGVRGCWHRGHERDPGRSSDVQLPC